MTTALAMFEDLRLWRDQTARQALPIVLWCAKHGHKITYGQLDLEIQRRFSVPRMKWLPLYGQPAGKIGDLMYQLSMEWGVKIPPVNAIIVNKETQLPGPGCDTYLERYLTESNRKKMTESNRAFLARRVIKSVFNFRHWDRVAAHFGVQLAPVSVVMEEDVQPLSLPVPTRIQGQGGESPEHKRLKEWVAAHPGEFMEYGSFPNGRMEVPLHSGDEVDVLFRNEDTELVVEVKASNAPDSEILRGLFQCVKYREVVRAMRLVTGQYPNAQAVLVIQRPLFKDLRRLADRLEVPWMIVNRGRS